MRYRSLLYYLLAYLVGMFVGAFLLKRYTKRVSETKIVQISTQKEQVITQATVQKDSNLSQQTIYIEKHYGDKGNLIKEVGYETNNRADTQEQKKYDVYQVQTNVNTSTLESKTIEEPPSNWIVSLYAKPTLDLNQYRDINNFEVSISYRVFGPVYLSAMSDVRFQYPKIGVSISF